MPSKRPSRRKGERRRERYATDPLYREKRLRRCEAWRARRKAAREGKRTDQERLWAAESVEWRRRMTRLAVPLRNTEDAWTNKMDSLARSCRSREKEHARTRAQMARVLLLCWEEWADHMVALVAARRSRIARRRTPWEEWARRKEESLKSRGRRLAQ